MWRVGYLCGRIQRAWRAILWKEGDYKINLRSVKKCCWRQPHHKINSKLETVMWNWWKREQGDYACRWAASECYFDYFFWLLFHYFSVIMLFCLSGDYGPFPSNQKRSKWEKMLQKSSRKFRDLLKIVKFPNCEPFKKCKPEFGAWWQRDKPSKLPVQYARAKQEGVLSFSAIDRATHLHFILQFLVVGAVWFLWRSNWKTSEKNQG